jgi:hypothetical protein
VNWCDASGSEQTVRLGTKEAPSIAYVYDRYLRSVAVWKYLYENCSVCGGTGRVSSPRSPVLNSDAPKYVMDICELCQKPVGYGIYVTDGKQPLHVACPGEADLKERDFIPAGRMLRKQFGEVTHDLIPPDDDGNKSDS